MAAVSGDQQEPLSPAGRIEVRSASKRAYADVSDQIYRRTFRFVVSVAAQLVFPKKRFVGGHAVGEGYYYELEDPSAADKPALASFTAEQVKALQESVDEIIASAEKINEVTKSWKDAVDYFTENHLFDTVDLLQTRVSPEVRCVECRGVLRLSLWPLLSQTDALQASCSLELSSPGVVASYSSKGYKPQRSLLNSVQSHIEFGRSQGIRSAGALNKLQQSGDSRSSFALSCEFRQEGKLGAIARDLRDRAAAGKPVKVICIAGPTSSGKTTFANKLCIYLQNAGFAAKPLTVDHYYLPLARQPKYQLRQQVSDVDWDHVESMDLELVSEHIKELANGNSVLTPIYNMKINDREPGGHEMSGLPSNGVLVIEGIHALNPSYTASMEASQVFKIFISPLTALQLDECNTVKTTNHRLLRRMCRDYLFRAKPASRTLAVWDNVRKGEGTFIFPFQNDVDFVVNSAAEYEVPVLKTFVEPLLMAVTPDDARFSEATELLKFLNHFGSWPPELSPPAALLREFIGGGSFDCH
eukprot:TRINITY_DN31760_c0_g1_i1.p1 TRINITY_DN31760_c0_g1~~TRINITY_DN31760_c0_g1_i1.p1  ORF type:complete len:528 (-),score=104.72 TRINITY_DN31760_c0_g1_i1:127-1710(-)